MGYSRADLQEKLSPNLTTLEQLRHFERVVDTQWRVAKANTYNTEEYRTIVLDTYKGYLEAVAANINVRTAYDHAIQGLLQKPDTTADGLLQYEEKLVIQDEAVRKKWYELITIQPDALDATFNVMSAFLLHLQEEMAAKQRSGAAEPPTAAVAQTPTAPTSAAEDCGAAAKPHQ